MSIYYYYISYVLHLLFNSLFPSLQTFTDYLFYHFLLGSLTTSPFNHGYDVLNLWVKLLVDTIKLCKFINFTTDLRLSSSILLSECLNTAFTQYTPHNPLNSINPWVPYTPPFNCLTRPENHYFNCLYTKPSTYWHFSYRSDHHCCVF